MSETTDLLRVEIENGEYTVVMDGLGQLSVLRFGAPWRECVGDKLIYALAAEVARLRIDKEKLITALEVITELAERRSADNEKLNAALEAITR